MDARPGDSSLASEKVDLERALLEEPKHRVAEHDISKRIPARDKIAGFKQIDLSPHYNIPLKDWDFGGLAPGTHTFTGCRFDVRGLVHLFGTALKGEEDKYPRQVEGMRINQQCRLLHFLQATSWESPDG